MMNWFKSLNGAVTLPVIALVSEAWRGFLDAMFVFPTDIADDRLMILGSVIFVLLFGGWAWAVIAAAKGSRRGLAAAFGLNGLVLVAIPISWLFFLLPFRMPGRGRDLQPGQHAESSFWPPSRRLSRSAADCG